MTNNMVGILHTKRDQQNQIIVHTHMHTCHMCTHQCYIVYVMHLPHTPTHPQDFTLDEKGFRELPQVSESSCPLQFLDIAFICCRVSYSITLYNVVAVQMLNALPYH